MGFLASSCGSAGATSSSSGASRPPVVTQPPAAQQAFSVAMDSDDDWDPDVGPGVVLRPHVLRWSAPAKDDADDHGGAGDKQQKLEQQLDTDPLHDPAADDE